MTLRSWPRPRYHSRTGQYLRTLLHRRGSVLVGLPRTSLPDLDTVMETRALVPLLMNDAAALQVLSCVRAAAPLGGAMAEAGVLMGGSARLICAAKGNAPLHLFDVFESLQTDDAANAEEAAVRGHFGRVHGSGAEVEALLSGYPDVHLHPGWFPRSALPLGEVRFAFVHLDMDLVTSTRDALDFFFPRLLPGGILLGDDYADPGVRTTFEAYFADRAETLIALPWGQGLVVKR